MSKLESISDAVARILFKNRACRINRTEWLSKTLTPYLLPEDVQNIEYLRPEEMVSQEVINLVANQVIEEHARCSSLISGGLALVGRSALALSTPTDLTQYWVELSLVAQKLAYLYGWDDFFFNESATEETLARLTLIIGYGLGIYSCQDPLIASAHDTLPRVSDLYTIKELSTNRNDNLKLISQALAQLAKPIFAGLVAKRTPIWGVALAGATNYFNFKHVAKRMQIVLEEVMFTRLEEEEFF